MTSSADALSSRQKIREIAALARADERTVRRVLRGEGHRNAAYERVVEAMKATGTDPPAAHFIKFGDLGEREIEFNPEGETVGIYVLVDPRDRTVRYVGAGQHPTRRMAGHVNDRSNADKFNWIEELRTANLIPSLLVIESSVRETAHLIEQKWIRKYSEAASLYNKNDIGYAFRERSTCSMEEFRGMSCSAALSTFGDYLIWAFAKNAHVRLDAIRKVLDGKEVWPETYDLIKETADKAGLTDLPPPAERASRKSRKPCLECIRLKGVLAGAQKRIAELEAALEAVRARGSAPARDAREAMPAPTVLPLPCRPRAPDSVTAAITDLVAKATPERRQRVHLLVPRDGVDVEVPLVADPPEPVSGKEFVAACQAAIEPRSDEEIQDAIAGIEAR